VQSIGISSVVKRHVQKFELFHLDSQVYNCIDGRAVGGSVTYIVVIVGFCSVIDYQINDSRF